MVPDSGFAAIGVFWLTRLGDVPAREALLDAGLRNPQERAIDGPAV
jgi:hypothetical protein